MGDPVERFFNTPSSDVLLPDRLKRSMRESVIQKIEQTNQLPLPPKLKEMILCRLDTELLLLR